MELVDPKKGWNAHKILGLDPMAATFTCIGNAITRGSRCRRPINGMSRAAADRILGDMSREYYSGQRGNKQLYQLASHLLCTQNHQYQADEKVQAWSAKIAESVGRVQEWNDMKDELQTLQEENEQLAEYLLVKDTQSHKLAREMKKMKQSESLSALQARQLSDLQEAHAALESKFRSLRLEHAESDLLQEEIRERERELTRKLANAEQKVAAQQHDLTEKGTDFKWRECKLKEKLKEMTLMWEEAERREAKLNEKLSATEQRAEEAETKLEENLRSAEEEIKQRETEFGEQLFKAQHETMKRDTELSEQLFKAEQDSKKRETELNEQLSKAEQEIEKKEMELVEQLARAEQESKEKIGLSETISVQQEAAKETEKRLTDKLRIMEQDLKKKEIELAKTKEESAEKTELQEAAKISEKNLRDKLRITEQDIKKKETELKEQRLKARSENKDREKLREAILNVEETAKNTIMKLSEKLHNTEREVERKNTELSEQLLKAEQERQERKELRDKLAESERTLEEIQSKKLRRLFRIGSRHRLSQNSS